MSGERLTMNGRVKAALFILLRAGLWERPVEDLSLFPLSADEWEVLYKEARKQTVTGVVYKGIGMLPDALVPPMQILISWVAEVDRIERNNRQMNAALNALLQLFEQHGLHPVVLKGQGVAAMYDAPLLRECGDIDLYFPIADRGNAAEVVRQAGIACETHADGSLCYTFQGVAIEHHTAVVDIATPAKKRYADELTVMLGSMLLEDDGVGRPTMRVPMPVVNLLMQNAHILKHAVGAGVGLRQLCDIARTYYILQHKIDLVNVREVYVKAGIARWSRLLHACLVRYIGLPENLQPYADLDKEDTVPLETIIAQGGNFGQYHTHHSTKLRGWRRKRQTLQAFWRRRGFAWRYARKEAWWTMLRLAGGVWRVVNIQ